MYTYIYICTLPGWGQTIQAGGPLSAKLFDRADHQQVTLPHNRVVKNGSSNEIRGDNTISISNMSNSNNDSSTVVSIWEVGGIRLDASSSCRGSEMAYHRLYCIGTCENHSGTVSSNSRFQTALVQQKSANLSAYQDSSKGGAVETGCSGFHYVIGCFIT